MNDRLIGRIAPMEPWDPVPLRPVVRRISEIVTLHLDTISFDAYAQDQAVYAAGMDACLLKYLTAFYQVDRAACSRYSLLDAYELEGSLIGFLMAGTCTERMVISESEARLIASQLVFNCFDGTNDRLTAFRMLDSEWSVLNGQATLAYAVHVSNPIKRRWWSIIFIDEY